MQDEWQTCSQRSRTCSSNHCYNAAQTRIPTEASRTALLPRRRKSARGKCLCCAKARAIHNNFIRLMLSSSTPPPRSKDVNGYGFFVALRPLSGPDMRSRNRLAQETCTSDTLSCASSFLHFLYKLMHRLQNAALFRESLYKNLHELSSNFRRFNEAISLGGHILHITITSVCILSVRLFCARPQHYRNKKAVLLQGDDAML